MSTLKVNELDSKTGTTISVAAGKTLAGTDIIGATQIAANAVTTAKILNANVTTDKILDDNVTYGKLQDTTTNNRVLGAVAAGTIGEVQVGSAMLSDDAVGVDKMAPLARGKIIVGDASGDPSALTVGGANTVLTSDGADAAWVAAGGGGLIAVTFLTTIASVTHTFNTDATKARFRVQAGGGGGSSAMNSGGAEGWVGSNGGYIEAWVDISPVLMTNCTVVVGAAGTAGGYGPGGGGTGGTSSVALPVTTPSVTLTCTGGGGGTVTTYSTTLSSPGLATVVGTTLAQLLLDSESNAASWNKFGLSPIGGTAGRPFYVSGPTVGTWGAPGGPGGNQGSTHRQGMAGGQGIVIIEEYI